MQGQSMHPMGDFRGTNDSDFNLNPHIGDYMPFGKPLLNSSRSTNNTLDSSLQEKLDKWLYMQMGDKFNEFREPYNAKEEEAKRDEKYECFDDKSGLPECYFDGMKIKFKFDPHNEDDVRLEKLLLDYEARRRTRGTKNVIDSFPGKEVAEWIYRQEGEEYEKFREPYNAKEEQAKW